MKVIRFVATMLVLSGPGLLVVGSAGGVPKPPPEFWSQARCERVMAWHRSYGPRREVLCVGIGGPSACRWTSGHRARLYSEFMVFTRYRRTNVRGVGLEPGVVRSLQMSTRARPGFVPVRRHWGDGSVGSPAAFFTRTRRLLATHASPARFRTIVAPIAARLAQQENGAGCTGAGN